MKKIDLGKPTTILNENMNRKDLYVDSDNTDKMRKNIIKQFGILNKSLGEMEGILNKMAYKKAFTDEYNNISLQCAKKCAIQAKTASTLKDTFEEKYKDDMRSYIIKTLDDRISYLESRILKSND